MATVYKTYNVLPGTFVSETFGEYFVQGANPSPPSWFDWTTASPFGFEVLTGYTFTATTIGTYKIYFTELLAPSETYVIVINVLVSDATIFENCCTNQYNLVWINREGGWQNYIFTGVREFTVDVGDAKTFITSDYIQKYSEVNGVYDAVIATTGDIPQSHIDILASLQYAIQAYLYDETEDTFTPILLDKKSFVKRKTTDKFFDVRIRFLIAEELLIQGQ